MFCLLSLSATITACLYSFLLHWLIKSIRHPQCCFGDNTLRAAYRSVSKVIQPFPGHTNWWQSRSQRLIISISIVFAVEQSLCLCYASICVYNIVHRNCMRFALSPLHTFPSLSFPWASLRLIAIYWLQKHHATHHTVLQHSATTCTGIIISDKKINIDFTFIHRLQPQWEMQERIGSLFILRWLTKSMWGSYMVLMYCSILQTRAGYHV